MMDNEIPDDLYTVMRRTYDDIIDFVVSPPFKVLVEEMYSLPPHERPAYVKAVLLSPDALEKRGVNVPDGILIQRSSFGDRRPTLFVVKKYLPDGYRVAWENLNITFDQGKSSDTISKEESAWRRPLPYQLQAALQCLDLSAEELEQACGE